MSVYYTSVQASYEIEASQKAKKRDLNAAKEIDIEFEDRIRTFSQAYYSPVNSKNRANKVRAGNMKL